MLECAAAELHDEKPKLLRVGRNIHGDGLVRWQNLVSSCPRAYGPARVGTPVSFRVESTTSPPGFRLEGEVDLSNASDLSELLRPAMRSDRTTTLDLSAVSYMDSTAIGVLVKAGRDLGGRGHLLIFHPTPLVLNVLKLIRADQLPGLKIVEEEA